MDIPEVGWGINWIDMAQDRAQVADFVNAVIKFRVP
jgi:hypothetical protein